MNNAIKQVKGGKVLLTFSIRDMPDGIPSDDPALASPPHWRLEDAKGGITCWGHRNNGTYESMIAIMRLAALGAKHATQQELIDAGIVVKPKLWTPDDGGDDTSITHAAEVRANGD